MIYPMKMLRNCSSGSHNRWVWLISIAFPLIIFPYLKGPNMSNRSLDKSNVKRAARRFIKAEILNLQAKGDVSDNEEGEKVRSLYIGNVFQLMPSGKYYQPWARSNVTPCPRCKGKGIVSNKYSDPAVHAVVYEHESALRFHMVHTYGMWIEGQWDKDLTEFLKVLEQTTAKTQETVTCPHCEGVGFREALLDELWSETAERTAEKAGCYLFSGEGDPCDLFIGEKLEVLTTGEVL